MSSLVRWILSTALIVVFLTPSIGLGLERTSVASRGGDWDSEWRGGSTCTVVYANLCTGWLWVWSGWSPQDVVGVEFESCCPSGERTTLTSVGVYVWTGAPSGYGYTGTLALYDADANLCPTGDALWTQSWLPEAAASGPFFVPVNVELPDSNCVVTFTNGLGAGSPVTFMTDHPAAGPTGPQACGFCYPSTRTIHSFYYGTPASPLCPGSALNDGVCDTEFGWVAQFSCATTAVEPSSWANVKSLYR